MPSSNKYKQLTDIKQDINLLQDNKINSIKPIAHKFEKEEELSPIPKRHLESYEDRTTKLIDIINEEKERKDKTIEMEDQYFMKEKEKEEIIGNTYKKNFFQENKEQIEKIQKPIERDKVVHTGSCQKRIQTHPPSKLQTELLPLDMVQTTASKSFQTHIFYLQAK